MKHFVKKLVSVFLFLVIFATATIVMAAESDDFYSTEYIKISGNNYIVDELNGVPAYYNQYNRNWQCLEYIKRYYGEIFDVSISVNGSTPYIIEGEGTFEVSEVPRVGDVVYWPSYLRRVNYGHVAIVKDYSDGVITLIEQNWRYNGEAAYERQITWPSSNYYVYTLSGYAADKIRGEELGIWDLSVEHEAVSLVSIWAADAVDTAVTDGLIDTSEVIDYTQPITRLSFCTMNAELLSAVYPKLADIPLISATTLTSENEDTVITREEAATIIVTSNDITYFMSQTVDTDSILSDYNDADLISENARSSLAVLVELGVYMGTGDDMLAPKAYATVEQAITWLIRTYEIVQSSPS